MNLVDHSVVLGVSCIRDGRRLAINVQNRASIDNVMDKYYLYKRLLDDMTDVWDKHDHSDKIITAESRGTEVVEYLPGFPTCSRPCHLDPLFFINTFIYYTMRLADHFNLNYLEIVATWLAANKIPHTTYFLWWLALLYCMSTEIVFQEN